MSKKPSPRKTGPRRAKTASPPPTGRATKLAPVVRDLPTHHAEQDFIAVLQLIHDARRRAFRVANVELIGLYWAIGEFISRKVALDGWGRGTVAQLAAWLSSREADTRGFSASNLWRMRQLFETWSAAPDLAPLVRELPWASNLLILGRCKSIEERLFYVRTAVAERWTKRDLERQLEGALFERAATGQAALSPSLRARHPAAAEVFKDRYLLDFLGLPEEHAEHDLRRALVRNLKQFLLELGRDFCFVGEDVRVQVGTQDFFIDLLFFHRGLQALVAIELKIGAFHPAHLGQLEFYLEALDRQHRKPHEGPSIGMLLCKTRDQDVVEYALARTMSPALVAEYQTKLPDKALLQAKLDEFYERVTGERDEEEP